MILFIVLCISQLAATACTGRRVDVRRIAGATGSVIPALALRRQILHFVQNDRRRVSWVGRCVFMTGAGRRGLGDVFLAVAAIGLNIKEIDRWTGVGSAPPWYHLSCFVSVN